MSDICICGAEMPTEGVYRPLRVGGRHSTQTVRDDVSRGRTIRHTGWVGLVCSDGAKRVRAIGNPLNDLGWLDTRTRGRREVRR